VIAGNTFGVIVGGPAVVDTPPRYANGLGYIAPRGHEPHRCHHWRTIAQPVAAASLRTYFERFKERLTMKNISTLLLGFIALVFATAALAGPDWDTIQYGHQSAQARTTPADQQKMREQCQGMMQNMSMDMHSGNMGMHHGMGNAGSQAPESAGTAKLYGGGK
jgi:hypothetical protein